MPTKAIKFPQELYIANKKYSSWSLRPWIAMRTKGIEFEEMLIPFEMATGNRKFKEFSPTGKVPCLVDGDVAIWESLAIRTFTRSREELVEWMGDRAQAGRMVPKEFPRGGKFGG